MRCKGSGICALGFGIGEIFFHLPNPSWIFWNLGIYPSSQPPLDFGVQEGLSTYPKSLWVLGILGITLWLLVMGEFIQFSNSPWFLGIEGIFSPSQPFPWVLGLGGDLSTFFKSPWIFGNLGIYPSSQPLLDFGTGGGFIHLSKILLGFGNCGIYPLAFGN